jgi:outer membrane protein OmpA-like peptidoglycan-associated protein
MRLILSIFLFALYSQLHSQKDSALVVKPGDHAPSFILNLQENTVQSYVFPFMRKIILLNFWSSNVKKSKQQNKYLHRLADRYKNATYRNADGFEVISIAVQTDRNAWKESITNDSLTNFTHGIAVRGYHDEVCKKYGVTTLPTDILIDELGTIVAINPKITEIENILDDRKNIQPVRKDVKGRLAQSSNKDDAAKYIRLYLFNYYGDSIAKTITSDKGTFVFSDIKINQDFILKVDNKIDITTSDPIALYSPSGDFLMDGRTKDQGFSFYISARSSNKLIEDELQNPVTNTLGQIDVVKHLTFFSDGKGLVPKDEQELNSIIAMLNKDKGRKVELITHTDIRTDPAYAMELTTNQANSIKNYLLKKGIAANRIKAIAKGNKELRKICEGTTDCREEDHLLNRRVEFLIYKD